MENKVFNCVDDFYQVKNSWGVNFGVDCAYRALQVQSERGFEIGYGMMLCKNTLVKEGCNKASYGGYSIPYAWHAWCEDNGNIYDSCGALDMWGVDVSKINSVVVIDAPSTITNFKMLQKYIKNIILTLKKKGSPDVVYIQGVGEGIDIHTGKSFLMDDYHFNNLFDRIDAEAGISGTTYNFVEIIK